MFAADEQLEMVVEVPLVTVKDAATPLIATLSVSLTVIVQVANWTPFATGEPVQLNVELATLGVCAAKVSEAVFEVSAVGAVIVNVRAPVVVAVTVQVLTPLASVLPVVRQLEVTDDPEVTLK